jgi:spermidine synthase
MIRGAALALTVLTGFAGLVYEVAWQKYLAALLGSHGEATAAVLAIFLGGLSLGYAAFGRAARGLAARAPLLLWYGAAEAAIGVYALVFPLLFTIVQRASLLVPLGHAALAFAFDVLLCVLLIGAPSALMGATIPLLTAALARDLDDATRIHARIYGWNTFGAFAGALAAGFAIVPRLGLDGAVYAMGVLDLAAGGAFAALARWAPLPAPGPAPRADRSAPAAIPFAGYAAVAALAGFAMIAVQTTLNRIGALALGSSPYTFSMVVAVFVLCTALGSLFVAARQRIPTAVVAAAPWLLCALLLALHRVLGDAPYWAHALRAVSRDVDGAFAVHHFLLFCSLLALLALPVGVSGALLPLLFHQLRRELGELGALAGRLYAWNTVGSLVGALLGGYLLLLWTDLDQVYAIAVAAIAVAAAALTALIAPRARVAALLAGAAALGAIALLPRWDASRLSSGLFREQLPMVDTFAGPAAYFARYPRPARAFADDDPTSTVIVEEGGEPERFSRSIVVNGKSDGNLAWHRKPGEITDDYPTMAISGLLPALIAERPERAFVIGWGTGVTAGELAALAQTRSVQVAEISRGVIASAPLFDAANLGASQSPKVAIAQGDAYRLLAQSDERYDVIVSEPSNPWVAGVEMLYSVEFLSAARARLAPGGVYAQWVAQYEMDDAALELVLRTFASVFPTVTVWFTTKNDLVLLGFDAPDRALDVQALAARFAQPDFSAGFARANVASFAALLAHEILPVGALRADRLPGPLHTLRNPRLSYLAGRAFFRRDIAEVPRPVSPDAIADAASHSLLRRYARAGDGPLPEVLASIAAQETCGHERLAECAALIAAWGSRYPDSPGLAATIAAARQGPSGAVLGDDVLADLLFLYRGRRAKGATTDPLVLTRRYAHYFHYADPFDRAALVSAWDACQGESCADARRVAEQRVGPLSLDAVHPLAQERERGAE